MTPKQVAITGQTRGLGRLLAQAFVKRGIIVQGFDRALDITSSSDRSIILNHADGADVFINNAYCKDGQTQLTLDWYRRFKADSSKVLVNVSSLAANVPTPAGENEYIDNKRKLDALSDYLNLQPDLKAKVINVKFGHLDLADKPFVGATTDFLARRLHAVLNPDAAVLLILDLLYRITDYSYVSSITLKGDTSVT